MSRSEPHIPSPEAPAGRGAAELSPRFWLVVGLTGVGAGLAGAALMGLLRAVQHVSYGYASGPFLDGVTRSSMGRRVLVMTLAGLLAGVAWSLLRRVSRSLGGLGGMTGEKGGRHAFAATLADGVAQIVVVAMGAPLGREGAPKQVGAAIARALGGLVRTSAAQRRVLGACGAGAGLAAVYNVPLGGALFALEVLLGSVTLPLVLPAFATALIATAVSWVALPDQPTFSLPSYGIAAGQVVWAMAFGPLAGLVAAGWVRVVAWAKAGRPQGWRLVTTTTPAFAALGVAAIGFPGILGNGKDVAQLAFVDQLGLPLLAALVVLRPLAMVAALRSGAAGGLFTPTLTVGALLGGLLGHLWAGLWPGAPVASYAVLGAGAMLAASMQAPVTAIVLVLELTDQGQPLMVPLLLSAAAATLVARALGGRSIYSE